MSAYLVSDKQLSVMAKSLAYYCNRHPFTKSFMLHKLRYTVNSEEFDNLTDAWMAEKFFKRMLNLNVFSLAERYEENTFDKVSEDNETYKYDDNAPILEIPALIKLIENWQYQSCEGNAENTQVYILFEVLKNELAVFYATKNLKGYWGVNDYSDIKEEDIAISGNAISLMSLVN